MARSKHEETVLGAVRRILEEDGMEGATERTAQRVLETIGVETNRAVNTGGVASCVACGQGARVRSVSVSQLDLECLALAYHEVGADTELFFHAAWLIHNTASRPLADFSRLARFGLVEPLELSRAWKVDTRGLFRLTDLGVRFLRDEAAIPNCLRVFNNRVTSSPGRPVTASDVWGRAFDIDAAVIRAGGPRRGVMATD